jgi:hypothetical protein
MSQEASEEIQILAKAPFMIAQKYSSYRINGFDFHTESYDMGGSVQNSGVALVAKYTFFERGDIDNATIQKRLIMAVDG